MADRGMHEAQQRRLVLSQPALAGSVLFRRRWSRRVCDGSLACPLRSESEELLGRRGGAPAELYQCCLRSVP